MSAVALITGAGRRGGIGAAIARALADDGWSLLLTGWRPYDAARPWAGPDDGVEGVAAELRAGGARAEGLELDLADPASAPRALEAAAALGPVTALVLNAAHAEPGGLEALTAATLDAHYAVNLRAPALLAAEFARRLPAGAGGRIVALTSGQGLAPMPEELAYAATKGGLEALVTGLAAALAPRGVSVNAVDPGPTDTGWMTPERRAALAAPMGRVGAPEDAARLVRWLVSEEAGWVTGQVVRSRGGA